MTKGCTLIIVNLNIKSTTHIVAIVLIVTTEFQHDWLKQHHMLVIHSVWCYFTSLVDQHIHDILPEFLVVYKLNKPLAIS